MTPLSDDNDRLRIALKGVERFATEGGSATGCAALAMQALSVPAPEPEETVTDPLRHFVQAVCFYLTEWEADAMTKREALHHIRHALRELNGGSDGS
jgi:hypothetical protein